LIGDDRDRVVEPDDLAHAGDRLAAVSSSLRRRPPKWARWQRAIFMPGPWHRCRRSGSIDLAGRIEPFAGVPIS